MSAAAASDGRPGQSPGPRLLAGGPRREAEDAAAAYAADGRGPEVGRGRRASLWTWVGPGPSCDSSAFVTRSEVGMAWEVGGRGGSLKATRGSVTHARSFTPPFT